MRCSLAKLRRFTESLATMTNDQREQRQMGATAGDIRRAKRIARFSKYVLLPMAVLVVVSKLMNWIDWSWWLVLVPTLLYLLHPIVIGALGPLLQYRRYRRDLASRDP